MDMTIARQRRSEHVSKEKNKHITIEGLLKAVFFYVVCAETIY
jgi:hypothetical protein